MIIFFITIGILILFYFMPIKIKLDYSRENKNDEVLIYIVTLYGLINYKIDLPFLNIRLKGKKPGLEYTSQLERTKGKKPFLDKEKKYTFEELKKSVRDSKKLFDKYQRAIKYFIDKIQIKKLQLYTEFDLEDAATTGIIAGILYIFQSNIFFWISQYKYIDSYQLNIHPLFKQQNKLHISISCIIQFKLGQIINVSIKFLKLYLKGGD